jgi:hypothetical protein
MGKGAQQHALVDANGATRTKANKCTPAKGSAPAASSEREVAVAPTVCAACGKEGSSRCSRCRVWYCSQECQRGHWSIHKDDCKRIAKIGGWETCHADGSAKRAASEVMSARGCDEGFCGICGGSAATSRIVHSGCACSSGAHLACLSRCAREYQQKSGKVIGWHRCLVCDQPHAPDVALALAKCQWRGSISLPDKCWDKMRSLSVLANALTSAGQLDDALRVHRADVALCQQHFPEDRDALQEATHNLAQVYGLKGDHVKAIHLEETLLTQITLERGSDHPRTLRRALCLATARARAGDPRSELGLLKRSYARALRALGAAHPVTVDLAHARANALLAVNGDDSKALGLKLFAEVLLEDALMHANKATAPEIESDLENVRAWLAPRRVAASRVFAPMRLLPPQR